MLFFDYLKYSNSNLSMIEYIIQKRYVLRYLFLYHDTYLAVLETKAGPSVRDQQLLVRTSNFLHISLQNDVLISQNSDQDRQHFQLSPEHWYLDVFITIYLNNAMNLYIPNCFAFFTSLTFSLSVNMTLITVTETEWIDFLGLKAFWISGTLTSLKGFKTGLEGFVVIMHIILNAKFLE